MNSLRLSKSPAGAAYPMGVSPVVKGETRFSPSALRARHGTCLALNSPHASIRLAAPLRYVRGGLQQAGQSEA